MKKCMECNTRKGAPGCTSRVHIKRFFHNQRRTGKILREAGIKGNNPMDVKRAILASSEDDREKSLLLAFNHLD